jgi:DNA-binding MarR family transcriptional regulator
MAKKKILIKKEQMVAISNNITGEMDNAKVTVVVSRDTPKFKGEAFTLLFQASTRIITTNITPSTAKMLLYICSIVDYSNIIPKNIPDMAQELKYSQRQVLRALGELVDMKVLLKSKHPQDNRISQYHINPHQSWKGATKDRAKKIAEYNKNQLSLFSEETKKQLQPNNDFLNS